MVRQNPGLKDAVCKEIPEYMHIDIELFSAYALENGVAKIRIDGCVIPDNTVKTYDYLLLCTAIKKAVFIELKGNKVKTAIEQLPATLDNEKVKKPLEHYKIKAYAVVTIFPKSNTGTQTMQDKFRERHKEYPLMVVNSSHTCDLLSGNQNK
ncbi:MAG: hypothetical protein LBC51_06540 [Treponema sp.]|jgi:hypothetical protein|nr:hypothetical protein [Treponema sp.]